MNPQNCLLHFYLLSGIFRATFYSRFKNSGKPEEKSYHYAEIVRKFLHKSCM